MDLNADLIGRSTYSISDLMSADDGDGVIHKRVHIVYEDLFAGAIELKIHRRDQSSVRLPICFDLISDRSLNGLLLS